MLRKAFDVDRFKGGVWGSALGGRVFRCHRAVATQEAELDSVNLCVNLGA